MESEHEETSVTLGISIPIDSSKNREMLREDATNQQPDVLYEQFEFSNLINSLDPNLGIMGQLPPADIDHEKGTFNPWNIEPHYLNMLPQYTSNSNENSILIVGGLNPSSILEKIPPDFDMDDFVLGTSIFQYVLDSGIWKYYGTMIEPRCYHACALDGQYLYITGGYSLLKRKHGEMIAISSTDRLNLVDRKWKSCANMVMSRAAHALVAHREKLYVFGGRNSQGSILASVEMYDPCQDFWFEIASLPRPTMGLSAICIKDSVWLIGGITNHPSENPAECLSSNVFSFVPSVKKWYEEVPLPYACAFSSCISNDYALWLIGGCTVSKNSKEKNMKSCSSVLKLSLSKKPKWKPIASLLYPRHALTAVLYGDNIYVLGGVESSNKCASDKVEVINIIGNIISTMCTRMPVPIAGCTSILIVPEKDDYTYTEDSSDTLSTFSERMNYKTGVDDYYSGESSRTSSTLEDVYDVNRGMYLPPMSPVNKESFPKKKEKIEIPVTQESSTFSERKIFKTGVDSYYSGESSKTSSTLEDVYDVNRDKYLSPMSPINKESFTKENEKIEIPITEKSSTVSERKKLKTGVEDYYSGESSKTSSTSEDVYDVNRDEYLPSMSPMIKETFSKENEKNEIPVTQESSTVSERKKLKTGVMDYSGESSKTSSTSEDVYDVNRDKYLPSMSPMIKETFSKENEKNEIPVTQESSTVSERKKLKTGVMDYSGESSKTSSTSEDVYDVNRDKYLPSMSPVNKETFPKENEKIEIPITEKSSTVSQKNKIKTGVEDYYSGESSKTSSTSDDVYDVNRDKYLPSMSSVNKETFLRENEKIEIPVTQESSAVSEKSKIKTGVEGYYSDESSKTSSILENVYDVNRAKYLSPISPINKEPFIKKNKKNEIPVTQKSSTFSERKNVKTGVEDYYSAERSKTSSTLEDVDNVNRNIHLSSISAVNQLHSESFKETFSKKMKNIETPVIIESFKKKGLFTSKVNELKTNRNKEIRYRTSMEIFLDSGVFGLYASKREPSQASKWLNYYKKFSLSDEKLHKEVFQSKSPELPVKTEVVNAEVNLKSPEVKKHFVTDRNLDLSSSIRVRSSLSSQHKSFMYAKSNVKEKLPDINVYQNNENRRKATSQDTVISKIIDLKLDILHNDAPDEIKIINPEDNFPVILLLGGEYRKKPVESRFILTYYCKDDVWYYAGELPEYRIYHSAVLVNSKIYIIGGFRSENSKFSENITNKTMYFDICDNLWHDIPSINHPRAHHSAVVLKDNIYVLGGRDQSGQILSSVEVYDESSSIWKECKSLPYPVLGAAAFSLDDSIHIFGGITYEEDDEIISVNTAIFDTKKNSWIADFKMPIPLAFCGIANDLNSIWLFGGLTIKENNLISTKDIYKSDIFTKTWTKVLELSTPRLAPVTVLIEEKAYVIGGHSTQEKKEVLTCELIDLAKNEAFLLKNLPIGISGRAGIAVTEQCKTKIK